MRVAMKGTKKTKISGLEFATVLAEQHVAMHSMIEMLREIMCIVNDRPQTLTDMQKKRLNEIVMQVDKVLAKEQEWLVKKRDAIMDILRSP
jgi:hypothetical protein